tara:strand:+ start:532 stop:1341 length:810 start_codon:yes stop_codon:yes gene_type:complete
MKVAGSSVEAALSKNCSDNDIYTGSQAIEDVTSDFYKSAPINNWKKGETLEGEAAYLYLKRHGALHLWSENRKKLNLVEPIYTPHQSPLMLLDSGFNIDGYETISIVRHPLDMLVSYFWYAFDFSKLILESKFTSSKREEASQSYLRPRKEDSIDTIKNKMDSFFNLPADFMRNDRPGNLNQNVLEWIAEWQNEFFNYNIDYFIKFENLQEDYEYVCRELNLDYYSLPRFKSSQRDHTINFSDFFSSELKEKVTKHFSSTFEKFEYDLN